MNRISRIVTKFRMGIVMVSILLCCTILSEAKAADNSLKATVDSLKIELSQTTSKQDSLRLMLNIFDLTPTEQTMMQLRRIFYMAKAVGDLNIQFDMLRQWVNLGLKWDDQKIIEAGLKRFEEMPECEDKRQTRVFIDIDLSVLHKYKSDAERTNYLRQLLRECADMSDDTDPYERVTKHYILIELLRKETHGDLLSKYTTRLGRALDNLPPIYHSYLRSKFNLIASAHYWDNNELLNSVKCDRNLLLQLRRLEKVHRDEQGRVFKNYDMHKYNALRRILRNYEILSEKEIRDYHSQIQALAKQNPKVAKAYNEDATARIGVMDLDGKYDEGIPMIKTLVENARSVYEKRLYLRWLVKFAEAAGNKDITNDAERQLSELLDSFINQDKRDERSRELQLLYDVNNIRRLATAQQLEREKKKTYLLYVLGIVILALLAVFVFLYSYSMRRRNKYKKQINELQAKADKLTKTNKELDKNLSTLRKAESERTQMISFLSHELTTPLSAIINYSRLIAENSADDNRDYIRRFSSIVEVNGEILQEVAKDITEMEVGENSKMPITYMATNVNALAEVTVESVKPQLKSDVTVEYIPAELENPVAFIDPRRVQIVLLSCISNMALLTEQGTISLGVSLDKKTCTYAITAIGKEIPEAEAKKVFAAWKDFDDDAIIDGLGLPNCQVILNALGATLALDPDCTNGTRLLFRIPLGE